MKSEIIIAALGALLTGCATQAPKHVLFVGMDGMSGRSFQEGVAAPNIRALAERGSWTWRARSILPASSAPNWASVFQCSGPELTGFVKWDTKEPVVPPPVTDANGRYPDFVARFRAANPSAKIGLAYEWDGIAHVLDTNACSFVRQGDCTEAAVRVIRRPPNRPPKKTSVATGAPDGSDSPAVTTGLPHGATETPSGIPLRTAPSADRLPVFGRSERFHTVRSTRPVRPLPIRSTLVLSELRAKSDGWKSTERTTVMSSS